MSWSAWPFGGGGGAAAAATAPSSSALAATAETDADRVARVLEFAKSLATGTTAASQLQADSADGAGPADDCMEILGDRVCAARQQNEQVQEGLGTAAIQFDDELGNRVARKFGRVWLRVARQRPKEPPELPANLASSGMPLCDDPQSVPDPPAGLPAELAPSADAYRERCKQWAARELARKEAARVYNELFEVHQRMQQPDSEVDLVWGLGRATWSSGHGAPVDHAIIEVPVEIELDRHDGALLVRPREYCDATLALAPFEQLGGAAARLMNLEKVREALHEQQADNEKPDAYPMTPSRPETYEKVLQAAAMHISSSGHFLPSSTASGAAPSQPPPERIKPSERLCVADTWAIFSRARSSNAIVRDIDGMIDHVRKLQQDHLPLPESALRFVRFGEDSQPAATATEAAAASTAAAEGQPTVLFPLPYNAAQEQIVGLLEQPDTVGVVVSGPPGTGKTHTIANIICHCLAKGQRVLVTSKGEQPLRVLQSKLPKDLQELTISLAQDERGGMKELQDATELLVKRVDKRDEELAKRIEECMHRYSDSVQELFQLQEHELKLAGAQFDSAQDRELRSALCTIYSETYDAGWWLMPLIRKYVVADDSTIAELLEMCGKISREREVLGNHSFSDIASEAFTADEIAIGVDERASRWTVRGLAVHAVAMVPGIGRAVAKRAADLAALLDTVRLDGRPVGADEVAKWQLVQRRLQLDKDLEALERRWLELADNPMNNMPASTRPSQHGREIATWVAEWLLPLMKCAGYVATTLQQNPGAMAQDRHAAFSTGRAQLEINRARALQEVVVAQTQLRLKQNMSQQALSSLQRFSQCLMRTGNARSSSIRGARFEKEAKRALESCLPSLPCWIMPTWRVSQFLPTELASFDLVVLDEASQSDALALPVLLRAKRMLIVGDERQVSPTEGFVSEERIAELAALVPNSVSPFRGEMLPGRSIFDLANVMFPKHRVVLTEHFRCAPQIIAYSNKEFYRGSLTPLRLPRASERLEPALLDNPVSGEKVGKTNVVEADAIVDEIWRLSNDKLFWSRSIGVISLMGADQARLIRRKLLDRLGDLRFKRHVIMCGDPPTFQGAEYDIIFLSMVASPRSCPTQIGLMYSQRFNVAMSRARDRVYLFRSISADSPSNDADLKVGLIQQFSSSNSGSQGGAVSASPYSLAKTGATSQLLRRLRQDGFKVQRGGVECDSGPAMQLIVHGSSDRRIGICIDGHSSDSFRNLDQWNTSWKLSIERRKVMARVGWKFWCCWETAFLLQPLVCYKELLDVLATEGIQAVNRPSGAAANSGLARRVQPVPHPAATPSNDSAGSEASDDTATGTGQDVQTAQTPRGQKRRADDPIDEERADGDGQPAAKHQRIAPAADDTSDAMSISADVDADGPTAAAQPPDNQEVKSAVAVAVGVAAAAAAGAGAIAAAPAALAAGVMVGQGAVIGAVSGAAAARSVASQDSTAAAVLGISDGADQAVVRAAFRQRISDASGDDTASSDGRHSKQAITSAFQALSAGPAGATAPGDTAGREAAASGCVWQRLAAGSATSPAPATATSFGSQADDEYGDGLELDSLSDAESDSSYSEDDDVQASSESDDGDPMLHDDDDSGDGGAGAAAAAPARRRRRRSRQQRRVAAPAPWRVGSVGSCRPDYPLPGVPI